MFCLLNLFLKKRRRLPVDGGGGKRVRRGRGFQNYLMMDVGEGGSQDHLMMGVGGRGGIKTT